jgi:hypothetical protein
MRRQRGALSLFWCAVAMGVAAFAAILALMSIRHERAPLIEAQTRLTTTSAQRIVQEAKQAIEPSGAPIRKCMINGKTVYSNTGCNGDGRSGDTVELHDTHGIEAPRMPAAASVAPQPAPDLRDRMIERAISR